MTDTDTNTDKAKTTPPEDASPVKKEAPAPVKTSTNDEEKQEETSSPLYEGQENDAWPGSGGRRTSMLRSGQGAKGDAPERQDRMQQLMRQKRASMHYVKQELQKDMSNVVTSVEAPSLQGVLSDSKKKELDEDTTGLKDAATIAKSLHQFYPPDEGRVGVRLEDFSYVASVDPSSNEIETVFNQSVAYAVLRWWKYFLGQQEKPKKEKKIVLQNLNLNFEPGKMYLVLGPPLSGKTTLLKAIAGRLPMANDETVTGYVKYNGLEMEHKKRKDIYVDNMIAFIGQTDYHAPRLTVKETFDFAFQCKSGGTHVPKQFLETTEQREMVKKLDKADAYPTAIEKVLGLDGVADTFVGNNDIRGVSGGQRRRVTTGEMVQAPFPIMCADELSTGLDSSSTYSICSTIMHFTQVQSRLRVLSLLQPSPETASLFDEIILIAEGKILYSGPVGNIEDYFASLGYVAPDTMDVADFCQVISSADGANLYKPPEGSSKDTAYTIDELAAAFQQSDQYQSILNVQKGPWVNKWTPETIDKANTTPMTLMLHHRYRNNGFRNLGLNLVRNLVIWSRDKRFLIANAIKNLIMGVSVGGVFYQTTNAVSIYGVLFQLNLFIMLGAMTSVSALVDDRIIFYRHFDANFYGAFAYAFGKAISVLPQSLCDVLIFGTICYFMVGLTTAASNYFIFIAILFVYSFVMNQQLAIFTAFANKSGVQAGSSVVLLFFLVFCGFLVTPVTIPNYYQWIYWWNPLAWGYRALLVNEFQSPDYDMVDPSTGERLGDTALANGGMIYKGDVFGQEWVAYSFVYMVPYAFLCTVLQSALLRFVRVEPKAAPSPPEEESDESEEREETSNNMVDIPFKPVTLTFTDVCYDVTASKGKDTLRLLNNANGVFEAGRMLALMGSSGAGKTTLMDVIALRKTTGTIQGDVRLNGFEQEKISFRRCSGYVEQFDVQSPQLTVRETVLFSARLRLNSEDPNLASDSVKQQYTDEVLEMLELTSLAGAAVGTDGEGGLSFEQRKRLSIAVELAASPSIIFLDEPTSGLDSRAALLVVKILRKIANQGRTVVATIHQPSSSVFEMFDDLLLLKKGGRTVFFGELGVESANLVKYFESLGATPIQIGENPADWMLTVITSDNKNGIDYVDAFSESSNYQSMQDKIKNIVDVDGKDQEKKIVFSTEYAADKHTRRGLVDKRLQTIYWRSPAYNLSRMVISVMIAFVLGSIYVTNRLVTKDFVSEQEMTGILSLIFISFIIIGVMSINAVLPVMLDIRDSFYRQRAAGMYGFASLGWGLGTAEKYFIIICSCLFCVVFLPCIGIGLTVPRGIAFWGFFTFNIAIYSYFGQAFVACVPTVPTAQILAAVFIGINNFFSGLIVRPQYLSSFFEIPYWITPGHYIYEGMVIAAFHDDQRSVVADPGSDFYDFLMCDDPDEQCIGTIADYINVFFGGRFSRDHMWYDILALALYLISARVLTFFALKHFNYTGH